MTSRCLKFQGGLWCMMGLSHFVYTPVRKWGVTVPDGIQTLRTTLYINVVQSSHKNTTQAAIISESECKRQSNQFSSTFLFTQSIVSELSAIFLAAQTIDSPF